MKRLFGIFGLFKNKGNQDIERSREEIILSEIGGGGKVLEYGPLFRPLAQREQCGELFYVDFADKKHLEAKYEDRLVNSDLEIPEIDIVSGGRSIDKFVADNSIDSIIASHVAEHVPNLIGWIDTNLRILKVGGVLSLAFPDRRHCFDIARQKTDFSELIAAHIEDREEPAFYQICDHFINVAHAHPHKTWAGSVTAENARKKRDFDRSIKALNSLVNKKSYVDVHCWIYSDEEFIFDLKKIRDYLDLNFEIFDFVHTRECTSEFYVKLRKLASGSSPEN